MQSIPLVHGHRGFRGLWPENTLVGFEQAAAMGVDFIELDILISADHQVVVTHDPYMNAKLCVDDAGKGIAEDNAYNLYKMTFAEIARFDCGIKANADFPEQQAVAAHKPLLSEVIDLLQQSHPLVGLNIEIKSDPNWDDICHPSPSHYASLVMGLLGKYDIKKELLIVQSFDPRVLNCMHDLNNNIPYSLLVEGEIDLLRDLAQLTFLPDYFAPDFTLLTAEIARNVNARDMRLMPWTVNEEADMERMVEWGATDIITDYPNRLIKLLNKS